MSLNTLCPIYALWGLMFILGATSLSAEARGNNRSYQVADVSLDQAVSDVKQRTGGRVLSADTVRKNGRDVHRIRVLNDEGKVRQMRVDGQDGREIRRRH